MAKFKGAVLSCKICGSAFKVPPSRAATAEFCSRKCAAVDLNQRLQKRVTLVCVSCSKPFDVPECHVNRRKYCSSSCKHGDADFRAGVSSRTSSYRNPMWKGGEVSHSEGYVYKAAPNHPYASNGYVFAHRLEMEKWLRENDPQSRFLIRLGNQLYLSPKYIVHHKDENRRNNASGNLQCMTNAEHIKLHNRLRKLAAG